jgi:hormone-sensitive lipase
MSSFSHQSYTRKWANYVGEDMIIFSIDYRLSPQYRYPYALEDVWQLYLWIINFSSFYMNIDIGELIIAGDSAGGNMALGVCFRAIKYGLRIPDGLLMAYPAVNLDFTAFNPYLLQGLVDEVAPATILKLALDEYLKGTNANPSIDPYLSPLIAHDSFIERYSYM